MKRSRRAMAALGLLAVLSLSAASCARRDPVPCAVPLVVASLPPIAGIVAAVAGEATEVVTLVGAGDDPHAFEPTPRTMALLRRADVYVTSAMPFEETLADKVAGLGFACRVLPLAEGVHDPEGVHDDAALHAWLSPDFLVRSVQEVRDALCELRPDEADAFRARAAGYIARVESVREETTRALAGCRGFVAKHPAYGAFAEAFGLEQLALEAHGREPGARHLADMRLRAEADGIRTVVLQSEAERRAVESSFGGDAFRIRVVPPLGGDPLETIRALAEALSKEER